VSKMGRINSSKVDEWLKEEKLELLRCWARDFTLSDIAKKIGVSEKTLISWRKTYPEIEQAIKDGKEIVDYRVENALLKVALGYTTTDVKTIISPPDKNGNRTVRVEKIEREVPPNPTAIMCWLNNRKPEQWKRNRDLLYTQDKDNNIIVNIIRKGANDSEEDEDWTASVSTDVKKSKAKKAKPEPDDLDYWPDDWEDTDE